MSVEIVRIVAETFQEDAPILIAQLKAGVKSGNRENVQRAAHSLKGLVANFEATSARDAASNLELAAKNDQLADSGGLVAELEEQINRVMSALGEFLEASE